MTRLLYTLFAALEPRYFILLIKYVITIVTTDRAWLNCDSYSNISWLSFFLIIFYIWNKNNHNIYFSTVKRHLNFQIPACFDPFLACPDQQVSVGGHCIQHLDPSNNYAKYRLSIFMSHHFWPLQLVRITWDNIIKSISIFRYSAMEVLDFFIHGDGAIGFTPAQLYK